jgi:hypothetical protein
VITVVPDSPAHPALIDTGQGDGAAPEAAG